MSNTLMNLGLSGLNAALWGITTTGENISNAATTGYSVERPVFTESSGQYTASGYLPTGVSTTTVQRQYSQYLSDSLNAAQSQNSALTSYYSMVTQLNNNVGSPTAGIASAITTYFTGLQDVSNSAADASTRQTAISDAQTLADQITAAGAQYDSLRDSVNTQLTSTVTQINSYTSQIAALNQQITSASAQGQAPNQLLDQRDLAVSNLSQLVGVQVVQNSSGYSVFLSGGQSLVVGTSSYSLTTVASSSDPSELSIASQGLATTAGTSGTSTGSSASTSSTLQTLPDSAITGGTLGGLLQFRDQTLDPAQAQLGAIAVSFAAQVNAQNALGIDQSGNVGGNLFTVPQPTTLASATNTSDATLTATFTDATNPPSSDYTLSYDGTKYTLTNRASGSVVGTSNSMPASIGGLDFSLSGDAMNAGDSFTVLPTRGALDTFSLASTNGSAIAAATPVLASASSSNAGTGAITQGTVSSGYQLPSGSTTLTYDSSTKSLSGFPEGTTVTIAGTPATSIDITSADTTVPYDSSTGAALTIASTTQPAPSGVMNGVSVTISGAPSDGDTFTIAANTSGTNDGRNALAMSNLVSATSYASGTSATGSTLTSAYAAYVNTIGNTASQLKTSSTAQSALVTQITSSQQSVSGVNTNEEAANLMQYQQLY